VVECAEADVVEVTAAALEEPVELTVASPPEPEDEAVFEPLAASLPMVADLADSIVVLDAAPDSDADGGYVAESDTVAPDGIPGAPAAEAMPAIPGPLAEGVEVDLSTAIGELRAGIEPMGSEPAAAGPRAAGQAEDLDRVFESFRDDAALRGLADEGAKHFRLAAAYREIGMIDECIGSLEEAAHSPRHRFEAASLLAETLREQGRTREAVEWYERAAEAPAPAAEAGRRLLFELGKTLADVGESERALAVFLELQADAPDYCDVAARVRRLSSAT
jgi:tetratricopeptide (TPR) repeat protein